jgi:molecular chaperone GrpE (heat shock protein)
MTTLSLAGNIVQFVDFSCTVISRAKELSNSVQGATQDTLNYEIVTRDLLKVSENLKGGVATSSVDSSKNEADQALEEVCNGCIFLSEKMLRRLENLKVQNGAGRRTIFGRALKSVWSQRDLDEMARQLASYRQQLELHVLVSFR